MRTAILLLGLASLTACGTTGPLKPAKGQSLPPRPVLASTTPDANDLLTPPPYARPERVDELVKRSTPRAPDRFDLPPPEGGAAPEPAPASDIDDPVDTDSDITGPER
ncbi:hypothetical protein [Sphingomicrobium flavum]|uniref:hypothetical protein n=1 Tax=Sphingomicrobium flavum TaxID=1229164 RepID=UPI00289B06CE|nr:hypothetical protein [Sphingomicrobium flavum]